MMKTLTSLFAHRPNQLGTLAAVPFVCVLGVTGCGTYDEARYPDSRARLAPTEVPVEAPAPAQDPEPTDEGSEIPIGVDETSYADTDPSALTEFHTTLEPYGTWVEDASYGTVWTPSPTVVGTDFAPYVTAGHWTYGDDYVWVSDYSWGWAPFHYGRWVYIDGRGWAWIPGRTYSGAWVTWRVGPANYDYIGWAPLPPSWYWRRGYAVSVYSVPRAPYVFCGRHDVFAPQVGPRIVRGQGVVAIGERTRPFVPANPRVGGPDRVVARPSVGPAPSSLGIANTVPPPAEHDGLSRARALASPSTAVPAGAAPPARPQRRAEPTNLADARALRAPRDSSSGSDNMMLAPRERPTPLGPSARGTSSSAFTSEPSRGFSTSPRPSVVAPPTPFRQVAPAPQPSTPTYAERRPFTVAPSQPAPSYTPPAYNARPEPLQPRPPVSYSPPVHSQPMQPIRPSAPSPSPAPRPQPMQTVQPRPSFTPPSQPAVVARPMAPAAPRMSVPAPSPPRPATPSAPSRSAPRRR